MKEAFRFISFAFALRPYRIQTKGRLGHLTRQKQNTCTRQRSYSCYGDPLNTGYKMDVFGPSVYFASNWSDSALVEHLGINVQLGHIVSAVVG